MSDAFMKARAALQLGCKIMHSEYHDDDEGAVIKVSLYHYDADADADADADVDIGTITVEEHGKLQEFANKLVFGE